MGSFFPPSAPTQENAGCERSSRIGSAFAHPDSAQCLFPPSESFRCNLISVRLAAVFLFVPTEFLRSGPCRIVRSPIPLTPASEGAIALFDRFRSAHESGLQFTPSRADHGYLATIVAHELESVQQGCRGAVSCLGSLESRLARKRGEIS